MPRGNDAQEAARELAEKYDQNGNAEDLIRSNRLATSPELRAASAKAIDPEATAELDLKKVGKDAGEKGEIIDASVRGDDGEIIYLVEDEDGRWTKGLLQPSGDKKSGAKKGGQRGARKKAENPQPDEEAAAPKQADSRKEAENPGPSEDE